MDLDTKNTKNSIILDGNQETVCVHSAILVFYDGFYSSIQVPSLAFQMIT